VELKRRGHDVTVYEADKVARGLIPFTVRVSNEGGLTIAYDGKPLEPSKFLLHGTGGQV
jgi:hypothetical protein